MQQTKNMKLRSESHAQGSMASLGELVAAGKAAYADQRYDDALLAFNKAHPLAKQGSTSAFLETLDQRVATHLKRKALSAAEQDARMMIRSDKTDGRGYLRCGQIERLKGDLATATKFYEYGLKSVPKSHHLHAYIETQLLKVANMRQPRKDPFDVLPVELLQQVLQFLDYQEAVRYLAVSKNWSKHLVTMRPLLDIIDLTGVSAPITYTSVRAALKRISKRAKIIRTDSLSKEAANHFRSSLDQWIMYTDLQELSISAKIPGIGSLPYAKYQLRTLQLNDQTGLYYNDTVKILKTCKLLETAKFHHICGSNVVNIAAIEHQSNAPISGNLQSLELGFQGGMPGYAELHSMLPRFPNLIDLALSHDTFSGSVDCDLSALPQLRKVNFRKLGFNNLRLPPLVNTWENYQCNINDHGFPAMDDFLKLSALQVLRMNACGLVPPLTHFVRSGRTSSMTHLDLTHSYSYDANALTALLSSGALSNLKDLRLGGYGEPADLASNLVHLKKLEELHLTLSQVTTVVLADMIRPSDCSLQHIHLTDCEKVTPDIVGLAESKYIKVTIKKTQASGSEATGHWYPW